MKMRLPIFIATLALAGCGGGAADNQAAAPANQAPAVAHGEGPIAPEGGSNETVAAARELLRVTNYEQQLPAMTEQLTATVMNQLIAQGRAQGQPLTPRMEAELRRIVTEENRITMAGASRAMTEEAAHIYARYFTADEIRELQRLQTTPVMRKMERVAPQFMSEMAQMGMRASMSRQPEIRQRIMEAMTRLRAEEGN